MILMYRSMLKPVVLFLILLSSSLLTNTAWSANSVRIFNLSADQWARPRAGEVIPQMDPVKLAIAYWESGTDAAILLSHAGEDSGEIWAAELKDWLISLGVPSEYILLSTGLQDDDEIRILVGSREELVE